MLVFQQQLYSGTVVFLSVTDRVRMVCSSGHVLFDLEEEYISVVTGEEQLS